MRLPKVNSIVTNTTTTLANRRRSVNLEVATAFRANVVDPL